MQLAHDNSDQRRKIADRSDLDSLVKMERGKRRITFYDSNGTDFFKHVKNLLPHMQTLSNSFIQVSIVYAPGNIQLLL